VSGNLDPILHRFGATAPFYLLLTPPLLNYFRRIPTYVITVPDLYRRTDRQTDGRHAVS